MRPEAAATTQRRTLRERFEGELARSLIGRGLVSAVAVEEALNMQLVMGGDLATNLWDLGLLTSTDATTVGAEIQRLKPAPVERLGNLPASIIRLLPPEVATRVRILPFARVDRTLHIASAEPWNIAAVEQVAFATHLGIDCCYLAEVPLLRLLHRYYQTPLPARIRLGPQAAPARPAEPEAEPQPPSMFAALAEGEELGAPEDEPLAVSAATETGEPELPEIELTLDDAVMPPEEEAIAAPVATVPEALALLDAAEDREAVGAALARFALSRGKRVALFVRTGKLWSGWTGAGHAVSKTALRALALPAAPGSVFGLVGLSGAPYLGPLAPHPIHDELLAALGGGRPRSVGLFPVHYRGKLSFAIYLDSGKGSYASPDLADLIIVAQRVPSALGRLVGRRLADSKRDPA